MKIEAEKMLNLFWRYIQERFMKIFSLTMILSLCFSLSAFSSEADLCLENAKMQSDMTLCSGMTLTRADAELNRVYNLIRRVYAEDKEFLSKLKISQRAWIKLRDADLEMKFPHEDKLNQYGRVYRMCVLGVNTTLTLQRIEYLKQWLTGIGEGDVCSGSISRPYSIEEAIKKYNKPKQ
jgi:uncharacterized protein YecT (DUF1311 family)